MSEGGEKTEMPTPKKLRDAREKGQVNNSKDITSTALLLVLMAIVAISTPMLMTDLKELFMFLAGIFSTENEAAVNEGLKQTILVIVKYSFIVCGAAALTGVAAQLSQIGFLFTFEPLKPDLNKINPFQGAKKIFCMKNFFEFFKNTIKITFLGYLLYKLIVESIPVMLTLCYGDLETGILPVLGKIMKDLAVYTGFGYILIAFADFFFQKKNFTKQMMMTKDEVKREYKEMEGSQEIKQAQREFANEILNDPPTQQAVQDSTMIVTNPTHLAIGVRYVPNETPLPKITVKGAGPDARFIRTVAAEAGIPVMENKPLARSLYTDVKVNDYVPEELFAPLIEMLKLVKAMQQTQNEENELDSIRLDDTLDELNEEELEKLEENELSDDLPDDDSLDELLDDNRLDELNDLIEEDDSETSEDSRQKTSRAETPEDSPHQESEIIQADGTVTAPSEAIPPTGSG